MRLHPAVLPAVLALGIACRPAPDPIPTPAAPEKSNPAALPDTPMTGEEAWAAHRAGVLFVDARPYADYALGHIPGALHVPLRERDYEDRWWDFLADPRIKPDKTIVVYCSGCCSTDSLFLALRLKETGFTRIQIYKDGFPGWLRAERPPRRAPIATGPIRP